MPAFPVYSRRFIDVAGFTGSVAFLVPTGFVCVVRDITAWVGISAGASVQAGLGGSAVFWGFTFGVVTVQATAEWQGHHVINEGEQLVLASSASVDLMASGYLLTLP